MKAIQQMADSITKCFSLTELTFQTFASMIYFNLWGNKADLSRNPLGVQQDELLFKLETDASNILVDNTKQLYEFIKSQEGVRIDFILDNAGLELVCDLTLADLLMHYNHTKKIVFHFKNYPVFVSDSLQADLEYTMDYLSKCNIPSVTFLVSRWQKYLKSDQWVIQNDVFWNSPEAFWDMPQRLKSEFNKPSLLFIKGDANCRRIHGDLRWEFTTPTSTIASYFAVNICIIRTLKSETASGIAPDQVKVLSSKYDDWFYNGNFGEIQFIPK